MTTDNKYRPGLEGIVAAETTLSSVDGQKGELIIAGFPLEELAANATFEEICCLFWYGDLPTVEALNTFKSSMASYRELPRATYTSSNKLPTGPPVDPCEWQPTFDLELAGEETYPGQDYGPHRRRSRPTGAYNDQDRSRRGWTSRSYNYLYMG